MRLIEGRWIKNELTLKRYRRFKKNKSAVVSIWILMAMIFFSLTAEFWANNRPILMQYHGKIYAPLFKDYYPTQFGRTDIYVMDYRALEFGKDDWVMWPIVQWDPYERNEKVENYPSPPTKQNWFGTDEAGRDVFTRLLYGFRYSLIFSVVAWFLAYLVGTLIGALMGYMGGKVDLIGSRLVEIFESVPTLLLLITIIAIFTPNMWLLILFIVVFDWTVISTYMRAEFLSLRKRDFVSAARALGASHWRVITKHILPNALTPLVTFSPFKIASNISYLAILDYLGFGLQPPTPSWGELLNQAQKYFTTAEWLVWAPSLALLITLVLLITLGLAVRDAFDAKAI